MRSSHPWSPLKNRRFVDSQCKTAHMRRPAAHRQAGLTRVYTGFCWNAAGSANGPERTGHDWRFRRRRREIRMSLAGLRGVTGAKAASGHRTLQGNHEFGNQRELHAGIRRLIFSTGRTMRSFALFSEISASFLKKKQREIRCSGDLRRCLCCSECVSRSSPPARPRGSSFVQIGRIIKHSGSAIG